MEKQLPKWFKGDVYENGGIVTNPFSGQSIELDRHELSMYDFLWGFTMFTGSGGSVSDEIIEQVEKGKDWFIKNNPEAYMVLLD
tara:strand:+ start:588 stop:839 length:252 start_codon:yes stop_codon:yes gene_type:complete